jgi:hypothetical protein
MSTLDLHRGGAAASDGQEQVSRHLLGGLESSLSGFSPAPRSRSCSRRSRAPSCAKRLAGTGFVVHLPTLRDQDGPADAGTQGGDGPEGSAVGGSNVFSVDRTAFRRLRILVMDDDVGAAEEHGGATALERTSCETANDGAAALTLCGPASAARPSC